MTGVSLKQAMKKAQRSLEEAAYGQGYALQTLAHILCAELSPDEGLHLGKTAAAWTEGVMRQ